MRIDQIIFIKGVISLSLQYQGRGEKLRQIPLYNTLKSISGTLCHKKYSIIVLAY